MEIAGTTAIVTGGASGLGSATARRLVRGGGRVGILDIQADKGQALAEELGASAAFHPTDVTSVDSVEGAIQSITEALGAPGVLVNCAGILIGEKIVGKKGCHDLDRFRRVQEVNLVGTFNTLRLAAQMMINNPPNGSGEKGVIVNTASIAAFEGQVGQIAYACSKAGIVGMTLPAARELARSGIRVCAIAPGTFDTEMIAGLPESVKQSLADQVPFPSRLGDPSEFADLVCHIVENPMLNGEVIRLDGALRMGAR